MAPRYSSTRCTVCLHPETDDIDSRLVQGETAAAVARLYGFQPRTMTRHRTNCLPIRVREAMEATEVEALTPEKLLAQVTSVQARALDLVRDSELAGDIRERAAALRELRSTVELLAKLSYVAMDRPTPAALEAAPDIDREIRQAVEANLLKACPKCGADLLDRTAAPTPPRVLELGPGEVVEAELCDD